MGLVSGLLLFLGSAVYVGGRAVSSNNARLRAQSISNSRGTNTERQSKLEMMSYGRTQKDKDEFTKLLGRDDFWFKDATLKERQYAIWSIAQKEGWVYTKEPGLMNFLPDSCYGYDPFKDTELIKTVRKI